MPYKAGDRLPGERASRLGHLEVLKSDLVRNLVRSFESGADYEMGDASLWTPIPMRGKPLPIVFGVDGSIQTIESESPPYKKLAFVKAAVLKMDQYALSRIDQETPHPLALRDILVDSASYHATVFPLRHVSIPGVNTYHAIRQIIFESLKIDLDGEPLSTLKWLAYEKWGSDEKQIPLFECPHCRRTVASLPFDSEEGECQECKGHLYLTDMLGFHQEMAEDSAPDTVATAYMNIYEVLLLFTGVRFFWENMPKQLSQCLFVKDGPLSIRAQYSKLVNPIRRLLAHARDQKRPIHILGQEKSGRFFDHLDTIGSNVPPQHLFVPNDGYIKEHIQHRPSTGAPYGKDTNYGVKTFVKVSDYHKMVLNIPTGEYAENPSVSDLLGAERIFATIPTILSNRYQGALLPIELAHGIASLSTYPSARILKVFTEVEAPGWGSG